MTIHKEFYYFLKDMYEKRFLILQLSKREIKSTFSGSFLGPVWIFLEPLAFMLILWLFFGVGLRGGGSTEGAPFVVYLTTGMISWFFFAQAFGASTGLIPRYSFLVKKVDFRLGILPIVNILSSLVSHIVLIGVVILISMLNKFYPTFYFIQLFYYLFATCILLLGLGWMASAINVFIKDTAKLVSIMVQFGFWLTPIFWNINMVPTKYQYLVKINPMYYIVTGYRDSIVYQIPFWDKPYLTLYFWTVCCLFILSGAIIFKRLRPHFAHVI